MADQDPYGDPTRVDVPVADPTQAMPATTGGPPTGGGPPRNEGPSARPPNRRGWILAGLFALVLLVGLAALLLSDDGPSATVTTDTTATTLEDTTSSSTTASTATTAPSTTAPTTTTAPPATVAPGLCTSGGPDDPDSSVEVLYQAYVLDDRPCAEQLATPEAVDSLFAIPGHGGGWVYQGCTEQADPDPYMDCAFTFSGGATHAKASYSDTDGWVVFDVYQTTD
jgi:hypothetical protein